MLKKILALALIASMAVIPYQVSAASNPTFQSNLTASNGIQPRYNTLVSAYPNLYIKDGKATCDLYMACSKNSSTITAKVTLYKVSSSGAKERIRYWPSLTSERGVLSWTSPSVSVTSGDYLMVVSATVTGTTGSDSYYEEVEYSY